MAASNSNRRRRQDIPEWGRAKRRRDIITKILLTSFALVISAIWLVPFFSGVTTAFKSRAEMSDTNILPAAPATLLFDTDLEDGIACDDVGALIDAGDACVAFFADTELAGRYDDEAACAKIETVSDVKGCELYEVYEVPFEDGSVQELALAISGRKTSHFMDPSNPPVSFDADAYKGGGEGDGNLIAWEGSWRLLDKVSSFAPKYENFPDAVDKMDFWSALQNTVMYSVISTLGAMISAAFVAYGFARFKFPFRNLFFVIMLSTIILPPQVTLIPTFAFWSFLGEWSEKFTDGWGIWSALTDAFPKGTAMGQALAFFGIQSDSMKIGLGSWWPLFLPHFFANAYNVFLLRQYFMTIAPEMEEAAKIDGAGPLTTFLKVMLPQVVPALVAVSLFHFFFAWNDFFNPLVMLAGERALAPLPVAMTYFNELFGTDPTLLQAGALLTLIVPVLIFFFAQRVFVQGVVVTGNK